MPTGDPAYMRAYREANREHLRELTRAWHARNPGYTQRPDRKLKRTEIARRYLLKKRGMTHAEFERQVKVQDGACAICGVKPKKLVIDHCHATGRTRGLLCSPCNSVIGFAKDKEHVLLAAIAYLRRVGSE